MGMSSAWDRRLGARAAAIGGVAGVFALLVMAATDDGASWARRAAMWGAIAPALGALGTIAAAQVAEARGELRALSALGVAPLRARAGAMAGGALLGFVGCGVAASGQADLGALFPRAAAARVWVAEGEAAMREVTLGARVGPGGALELVGRPAEARGGRLSEGALPGGARGAVIATLAAASIACPLWIAAARSRRGTIVAGVFAVALLIVGFHAAAAGRAHPAWLLAAPLLLLADALRYGARGSR